MVHAVEPNTPRRATPDIRDYLSILRRRKWTIISITLLTMGAVGFLTFRATPMYTSEARVLVRPIDLGDEQTEVNLETERALVESTAVADVVVDNKNSNSDAASLLSGLSASVEGTTEILLIEYTASEPARAQSLAQGFANAYLGFRREQARAESQEEIDRVQDEIDTTKDGIAELAQKLSNADDSVVRSRLSAERDSLVARLGVLQFNLDNLTRALGSIAQSGGQVVEPAELPGSPSSPQRLQDMILGLFVGLVLGVGVAFLRERLDDRLRDRAEFEGLIGAQVLAAIPRVPGRQRKSQPPRLVSVTDPSGPAAEAYRTLRTGIQFIASERTLRVAVITSPGPGEGKTATTANLAVALATAGKEVIAISGDLRRPSLHRFFGLDNNVGLADVLMGTASADDAIQATSIDGVSIMAGGPVPANPAELLDSSQMHRLIRGLRSRFDFVLVDGPPVLAMADALILSPYGDGVVIVADAGSTTHAGLLHAREQIEQVGGKIVGGVLNKLDPKSGSYYSPYYGSSYSQRYRESDTGNRKLASTNGVKAPERLRRRA